jgi:phosphoribosylaminoimidazole-succinocarboxamide synthase
MISADKIRRQLTNTLDNVELNLNGDKQKGKVREAWFKEGKRLLITTDRVSAFDRVLTTIPFKGQVLNQLAAFWFKKTKDIVSNHVLSIPHPNALLVRDLQPIMVEMVVRGYITGNTSTSAWTHYKNGVRNFCGNILPEDLRKDQKFDKPIVTPSTKADQGEHDESVSPEEIVSRGVASQELMDQLTAVSLALFERGTEIAAKQGIILVDTKYEFGLLDGKLLLIDEIHTPDSSRFWYADTYQDLFEKGEEQRRIDKDYIRTWLAANGFTGDGEIPEITEEVRLTAAAKYIEAFEVITGTEFQADEGDVLQSLQKAIIDY